MGGTDETHCVGRKPRVSLHPLVQALRPPISWSRVRLDTSNVLNYGMGYNLQRYSPLTQINKDTAKNSRSGLELQFRR